MAAPRGPRAPSPTYGARPRPARRPAASVLHLAVEKAVVALGQAGRIEGDRQAVAPVGQGRRKHDFVALGTSSGIGKSTLWNSGTGRSRGGMRNTTYIVRSVSAHRCSVMRNLPSVSSPSVLIAVEQLSKYGRPA